MEYFKCAMLTVFIKLFTIPFTSAYSQDTAVASPVLLKVKLKKGGSIKGYIPDITDSSVIIVPKNKWENGNYDTTITIPAENIRAIAGKKRGVITKFQGAAMGFGLGYLIGFGIGSHGFENTGTDNDFLSSPEMKIGLYLGAALGAAGLVAGIITKGKLLKKKFKIKGNRLMLKHKRFEILSQ